MPSSLNLRQKLNTGHYGPAPTVNVIPELDGNRVKEAENGGYLTKDEKFYGIQKRQENGG